MPFHMNLKYREDAERTIRLGFSRTMWKKGWRPAVSRRPPPLHSTPSHKHAHVLTLRAGAQHPLYADTHRGAGVRKGSFHPRCTHPEGGRHGSLHSVYSRWRGLTWPPPLSGGGRFQQAAPSTHAAGGCYSTLHARGHGIPGAAIPFGQRLHPPPRAGAIAPSTLRRAHHAHHAHHALPLFVGKMPRGTTSRISSKNLNQIGLGSSPDGNLPSGL